MEKTMSISITVNHTVVILKHLGFNKSTGLEVFEFQYESGESISKGLYDLAKEELNAVLAMLNNSEIL